MKTFLSMQVLCIGFLLATPGSNIQAQSRPEEHPQSKDAHPQKLTAQQIKTGLFLISGGGANSTVRLSGRGVVLVDGKLPDSFDALHSQIKRISDMDVRALILTNGDADHTGTNAKFLAAGAHIIVNKNAGIDVPADSQPASAGLPPVITFDREYMLRIGGIEAQVLHFGSAHTGGDSIVYFPNLKTVAVGNLYSDLPDPEYSRGGSLVGWGPVLEQILKLDFDVVIPAQGPAVTKGDLGAFKTKMDTLVSRANGLVKSGITKDQFINQLHSQNSEFRLALTAEQAGAFYDELSHLK